MEHAGANNIPRGRDHIPLLENAPNCFISCPVNATVVGYFAHKNTSWSSNYSQPGAIVRNFSLRKSRKIQLEKRKISWSNKLSTITICTIWNRVTSLLRLTYIIKRVTTCLTINCLNSGKSIFLLSRKHYPLKQNLSKRLVATPFRFRILISASSFISVFCTIKPSWKTYFRCSQMCTYNLLTCQAEKGKNQYTFS